MGTLDILTDVQAQTEYEQRLLVLQEQYGALPQALSDALIFQAVVSAGIANLTGCSLEGASIHTRLAGLRLLTGG
jgi:hypothetical protein